MNSELRKRKKQLLRMNLKDSEFTYVKTVVKKIFDAQIAPALTLESGSSFYRVRSNPSHKPHEIKDIREPPWEVVTGFQRCNSPSYPIFYASNRVLTAALETNISDGDVIYFSQWKLSKPMRCTMAVFSEAYEGNSKLVETIPPSSLDLIEFFEIFFTRPVHETFSEQYKITAAITEMLTADAQPLDTETLENTNADRQFFSTEGHMAIAYKSVVDNVDGNNFAFHPSLVNEFMFPANIVEAEVISRENNNIILKILDFSNRFENQKIVWSNDPSSIPFIKFESNNVVKYEGMKWMIDV